MGRLSFISMSVVNLILFIAMIYVDTTTASFASPSSFFVILFFYFIVQLLFTFERLNSIGLSKWAALSIFIPIVNFYTNFLLVSAPVGYKQPDHENYNKTDIWYFINAICYVIFVLMSLTINLMLS